MIVMISGGKSGVENYLEKGMKKDREHTRDELDERVILDGNLFHTRQVIASIDTQAERYLHITLGFKEDHISPELLQTISDDFRAFSMHAYDADEYDFYSEAHLPKIKTLLESTGELIERKPHIHIVIPKVNLLTGNRIDPFELVSHIKNNIDAFQEVTNEKYGLESPKINLRTTFNSSSEIVSRHKGDIFIGQGKALKETAFNILMESKIQSLPDFSHALSQAGFEVKIRNAKNDDPYLNIKMNDHSVKGVNLKDLVFRSDFLAKSLPEKHASLSTYDPKQYIEQSKSNYRATPKHHQDLKHWYEQKSYEVRYVGRRNREQYKQLNSNEKIQYLTQKRENKNDKNQQIIEKFNSTSSPYRTSRNILESDVQQSTNYNGAIDENLRKSDYYVERIKQHSGNIRSGTREYLAKRHLRAIVADLQQHRNNQGHIVIANVRERVSRSDVIRQIISDNLDRTEPDLTQIKRSIDTKQLLNQLHLTHGLITDKYPISVNEKQEPRIKCGERQLNVSDFMTKELNLSWKETRQYLIDEYQRQNQLEIKTDSKLKLEMKLQQNRQLLKNELRHIHESEPSHSKKQSLISIAKVKKVLNDIQINQQIIIEHESSLNKKTTNEPLEPLDDLVIQPIIVIAPNRKEKEEEKPYPPLEVDLKVKGMDIHFKRDEKIQHVVYSEKLNNKITNMFVDKGDNIKVLDKKDTSLEVSLLFAKEKYGQVLNIKGTEEYQNKLINIAAKKNIDVEFSDPVMNQKLIEMKKVMMVGKSLIQKQSNAVTKQPDLSSQKIEQLTKGISR